MRLNKR